MNIPTPPKPTTTEPVLQSPSTVYVDQIAQIAVGPFVSKLIFGTEARSGEVPKPVQTIVMPTPALLQLHQQLGSLLEDREIMGAVSKNVLKFADALQNRAK
jgi:hypothetical protein